MPSYVLYFANRRELRLRCTLCEQVAVLTTAAEFVDGEFKPAPSILVSHHYRGDRLGQGRCPRWNGDSQDFYVKDPTRRIPTQRFSWPEADEEEDYEYYIRCTECGAEEGYSGPTDVGPEKICDICDHALTRHEIITSAGFADPDTGGFALPVFR